MLRLGDRTAEVTAATLEIFHLFAVEAGWVLEATVEGIGRFALEGRVKMPALPGPSELVVAYVDAPRVVTIDEQHGTLVATEPAPRIRCVALGAGRVRLAGTLAFSWRSLGDDRARPYVIELAFDAALIT